jgi:hypothetical protein
MVNRPPISGPLGLGDLLDRAFRLYRARFSLFLLTAAIFLVPFSLLSGLLSGRFLTSYFDALGAFIVAPDAVPDSVLFDFVNIFGSFFGLMALLAILGLLINGMVTLALTSQSIAILHEEPLTLGQSVRRGLRRLGAFIWMSMVQAFLIFLATLAVMIPFFILIFLVIFAGTALGTTFFENGDSVVGTIGIVLVILCGYLLAIVLMFLPMIYLSARWIAATPVLMAEQLGATEALRRSWRLTHRRVWRAVGYLLLLFIITAFVISLPVGVMQQLLFIVLPTSEMGVVMAISTALSSLFSVIWSPFYACAVVLLYYDLRVRAEGYDLDLRVQQLEAQIQNTASSPTDGRDAVDWETTDEQ